MIVSRITTNTNKLLCKYLMSYCISRKCSSHLKKYCKNELVYYFIHRRELRISTKFNQHSELDTLQDGSKTNSVVHIQEKQDKIDVPVTEYVKNFYKVPLNDLTCIYAHVRKEFDRECMSVAYKSYRSTKTECVINVTWPCEKTFSYTASRKRTASAVAALMCLDWLHAHDKIKERKPILYSKQERIKLLQDQQAVNISLTNELQEEIQLLINKFNNEVQSVMVPSTIEEDSEISEANDNYSGFENEVSETYSVDLRNKKLKENFLMRLDKTNLLPIDNYREEIINSLENNRIIVIVGETGCGKSTQVPQMILDDYAEKNKGNVCNIIVTEPRRVSAISLAEHVAYTRDEVLGNTVGYHVRFNNTEPDINGSILYCTTGVLLRKLPMENYLKKISHVIIDEAHERSFQTDVLLKLMKDIMKINPHMKLIIMSATMNAALFQQYFSCPIINVPGTLHPVKMHFLEDIPQLESSNNNISLSGSFPLNGIANLIIWIVRYKPPGAILCFLPGWNEIKTLHTYLTTTYKDKMYIVTLHSKISNVNQQKAFYIPPENVRKIILSTDIAETGITIKDVTYVIDTALKKDVVWDADKEICRLVLNRVARANILQRKGRAGRLQAGESYHLITKKEYDELDYFPKAEITKMPLEEAVITSKIFSEEKAHVFFRDMLDPPPDKVLNAALETLRKSGIIDAEENLTTLGKRVSSFALGPQLSKAIILSAIFECVKPIMLIATLFSTEAIHSLWTTADSIENIILKESDFSLYSTSDHIEVANYYEALVPNVRGSAKRNEPLYQRAINANLHRVYEQHMDGLMNSNLGSLSEDPYRGNKYGSCNELVRGVLFASTNQLLKLNKYGFKLGHFTRRANIFKDENNEFVTIEKTSVNYNRTFWPSELLTYVHKMEYMRRHTCVVSDTSLISPLTVLLFSQGAVQCHPIKQEETEEIIIEIKDIQNLHFRCDSKTADLLLNLRTVIWNIVDFIIEYDGVNSQEISLCLVQTYKSELMSSLTRILQESASNFDKSSNLNN